MKRKILIVDDSEEFSFLLASLFKFHELEVKTVSDGVKAQDILKEETFDIVITDYLMEPINGLELSKILRDSFNDKLKHIVLVTAKNLDEDELKITSELNLLYLMKPIMPNVLYQKLKGLLDQE